MRTWLDVCPDKRKRKLLNTKDKYGFAAAHYAARFNRFKIMQLLLLDDAGMSLQLYCNLIWDNWVALARLEIPF